MDAPPTERGQHVIARASNGRPVLMRVWETAPYLVYVCSEKNYNDLMLGERGLWPVGVPRDDVFVYTPELLAELGANWQTDPAVWDKATLWTKDKG